MRRRLPALAALAGALALTACSQDPVAPETAAGSPGDLSELTVGLTYIPDIQFAPFYVAEELGFFADEGLEVTLRHHGASESLLGALAAGEEDVVNAGGDEMLQAFSQGVPVVTFGTMYQDYPVVLVVTEDSGIATLPDLAGHTVGVPGPFGENWFGLLAMLQEAGLTEQDVTIKHIGYTQQAALIGGSVDAVVGFVNNDVVNFRRNHIPIRTLTAEDLPLVGISVGALRATLEARGDDLAALNRALARAMDHIAADPADAVRLSFDFIPELSGSNTMQAAEATLTATAALYGAHPMRVDDALWPPMYDFMVARGLAAPGIDPSRAVTTDLNP